MRNLKKIQQQELHSAIVTACFAVHANVRVDSYYFRNKQVRKVDYYPSMYTYILLSAQQSPQDAACQHNGAASHVNRSISSVLAEMFSNYEIESYGLTGWPTRIPRSSN